MIQGDVGFCFDLDIPKHVAFFTFKKCQRNQQMFKLHV